MPNNQSSTIEVPLSVDEITHLVKMLGQRQDYDDGARTGAVAPEVRTIEALIMIRLLLCLRHAQSPATANAHGVAYEMGSMPK